MKKIKLILTASILLIGLTIFALPSNPSIKSSKYFYNKNNIEDLKCSDKSGGGYIMNTNAAYSWIEINETGTRLDVISEEDDDDETISFLGQGWNFTFYETEYIEITVSSNGWMSFADEWQTQLFLDEIPSQGLNNIDCVALLAEDLNLDDTSSGGGDVYYNFSGTAPDRYLVIEYYQTYDYYNKELVGDFEVIFCENGTIKFQYKNVNNLDHLEPLIGLDHGDMTNYNLYDANLPLTSKAIAFYFNQLEDVNYTLGINGNDKFSWKIIEVNHTSMESVFGSEWEQAFGLLPSMSVNEKTLINISLIKENATHWEIKYDMWNWTNIDNNFDSIPDVDPMLIFRKEPLNYTEKHDLMNFIPLFLPIYPAVYLRNANLKYSYSFIQYYYDEGMIRFWVSVEGPSMLDEVVGNATYTENGILEEMHLVYKIDGNYYPALWLTRIPYGGDGGGLPYGGGGEDDGDDDDDGNGLDLLPIILVVVFTSVGACIVIIVVLIKKGVIKLSKV